MNFGQNLYNWFLSNAQSLVLMADAFIGVYLGFKREFSKLIGFLVIALIVVGLVKNERYIRYMKIFVSWSGELSRQIAEVLKKWIPCIIQSVEVFFSPEDIEKGDNWDKTISTELSECNYGIICLTTDNTTAPWINFEAGAIAKSLDSKVTALMINIKPSDIKGPLSRYQATKFEKDDFLQLITSINKALETPLDYNILQNTFNAMWTSLETEANAIIEEYSEKGNAKANKGGNKDQNENEPIEEILQLLRKQSTLLSNPESILPLDYMDYIFRRFSERNRELNLDNEMFIEELLHYLSSALRQIELMPKDSIVFELLYMLNFDELFQIMLHNIKRKGNKRYYSSIRNLERQYLEIMNNKSNVITDTGDLSLESGSSVEK